MGGGGMSPLAAKFFHFDHWGDTKLGLISLESEKMAVESSPRAHDSPPLEKFLQVPMHGRFDNGYMHFCISA